IFGNQSRGGLSHCRHTGPASWGKAITAMPHQLRTAVLKRILGNRGANSQPLCLSERINVGRCTTETRTSTGSPYPTKWRICFIANGLFIDMYFSGLDHI